MSEWPSTRARQVLAALLRIGWRVKRTSGSHRTLSRDQWADFVFAFHEGEKGWHGRREDRSQTTAGDGAVMVRCARTEALSAEPTEWAYGACRGGSCSARGSAALVEPPRPANSAMQFPSVSMNSATTPYSGTSVTG